MMSTMVERSRALSDMIARVHERVSYYEMSRRAERAGHKISHAQMQSLANGAVAKPPNLDQQQAIAAALGLDFETVRLAVFEEFFHYVPRELRRTRKGSRIVAALPANMSPDEEEQLARMVEAWVASRKREL